MKRAGQSGQPPIISPIQSIPLLADRAAGKVHPSRYPLPPVWRVAASGDAPPVLPCFPAYRRFPAHPERHQSHPAHRMRADHPPPGPLSVLPGCDDAGSVSAVLPSPVWPPGRLPVLRLPRQRQVPGPVFAARAVAAAGVAADFDYCSGYYSDYRIFYRRCYRNHRHSAARRRQIADLIAPILARGFLRCQQQAGIMLRMLEEIFRRHPITRKLGVARQRQIFVDDLLRRAAHLAFRPRAFINPVR